MYKRYSIRLNSINFVCARHNYMPSTSKGGTDKEERQGENITWVNADCYSQVLGRNQNEA